MRGELPIPETCYRDIKSFEMIRAWIAERGVHVALNVGVWDRPDSEYTEATAWGILLADIAHHISNALEKEKDIPLSISLKEIGDVFQTQLRKPSSDHPGDFYVESPSDS